MKRAAVLLFALLAGCAAYLNFDAHEYSYFVDIVVTARQGVAACAHSDRYAAETVLYRAGLAEEYAKYRSTPEVYKASQLIKQMAESFNSRFDLPEPMSLAYCQQKFNDIADASEKVVRTIAKKE